MKALFDYTKVNNILAALERMPLAPVDCQDNGSPAEPMRAALRVIGTSVISEGHYGCVVSIDVGSVLKLAVGERDGYPAYIEWAARNPQPHVPRVLAHGWIGPMFWCVLPRYFRLDDKDAERIDCMSEKAAFIKTREAIKARFSNFRWDLHPANMMFDRELGEYIITDPLANVKGTGHSRDCIMYRTIGVEQLTIQAEIDFDVAPEPSAVLTGRRNGAAIVGRFLDDLRGAQANIQVRRDKVVEQPTAAGMAALKAAIADDLRPKFAFPTGVSKGHPQQIPRPATMPSKVGPDGGVGCVRGDDWGSELFRVDWRAVNPSVVAIAWDGDAPRIVDGEPTCFMWRAGEGLPLPGFWRACRVRPGFKPRSQA